MKIQKSISNVRPVYLDNNSSPTMVYISRNIVEKETIIGGISTIIYEYDQYVFSKQEYVIYQTVKDWTAEQRQTRIDELLSYLSDTDWYASRFIETGEKISKDIKQARADARIEISLLRDLGEITNE